jgi:hypothetical protein
MLVHEFPFFETASGCRPGRRAGLPLVLLSFFGRTFGFPLKPLFHLSSVHPSRKHRLSASHCAPAFNSNINIRGIDKLFRYCRETGRHATFRAAGTSLNGQSQSDDILIDVRRHWYGGKVEDDGRRARARPG